MTSELGRCLQGIPVDSNKLFKMGVYLTNSDIRVFHVKDFNT